MSSTLSLRDHLDFLQEVGQIMVGSSSAGELGTRLAHVVCRILESDACVVRRLEGDKLVLLGACGLPEGAAYPEMDANLGIAAQLISGRAPVSIDNSAVHPATARLHSEATRKPGHFVFLSYAGAPMIFRDEVVGILGIYSTKQPRQYTAEALAQLQVVANQVAIAIVNHLLYDEMRQQNLLLLHQAEQRERAEQQLQNLMFHDSLTGLPTRRLFVEHLRRSLHRTHENHHHSAVLFIDCDRFSLINETQGHESGDKLLVEIARRISQSVRSEDIVARLAGDAFLVLAETFHETAEVESFLHALQDELHRPYRINGCEVFVTFCIGISYLGQDSEGPEDLMRASEMAMRHAKNAGRNQIYFYDPSQGATMRRIMELEVDLRHAVQTGKIDVNFQPIIDTRSRTVCGFEALARWNHPIRGEISPVVFIPIAEDGGMIRDLGWGVLVKTIQMASERLASQEARGYVSVNLSVRQLLEPGFPGKLTRLLHDLHFPARQLYLEITESMLMNQSAAAIEALHTLRNAGISILVDDFGTGYSSLSYLHSLPVSGIKIDRSFVRRLDAADGARLVTAIVQMAHALGLFVIAEGVEEETQRTALVDAGVDFLQGHLLGRPSAKLAEPAPKPIIQS